MHEDKLVFYITAGNKDEAEKIAGALVERRLAACVNIFSEIKSVYMWKDNIQKNSEISLIAKTTRSRADELVKLVKTLHSYETPCIISFKIDGGDKGFLKWIEDSVL